MATITVSKLDKPYRGGDFKDPLTKWTVQGPGNERQDFCTQKNAKLYARLRRNSPDQKTAGNLYVAS